MTWSLKDNTQNVFYIHNLLERRFIHHSMVNSWNWNKYIRNRFMHTWKHYKKDVLYIVRGWKANFPDGFWRVAQSCHIGNKVGRHQITNHKTFIGKRSSMLMFWTYRSVKSTTWCTHTNSDSDTHLKGFFKRGGVAQWVARLTRDRWIHVSR